MKQRRGAKGASFGGLVSTRSQFGLEIGDEESIYLCGDIFKGSFSPQLDLDGPFHKEEKRGAL